MGRYDLWVQQLDSHASVNEPRHLTEQQGSVAQPSFSPDGRWIAYHRAFGGKRHIWMVPVTGGPPRQLTSMSGTEVEPDWSPDGSEIVFVSEADGSSQLWTLPVKDGYPTGSPHRLTSDPPQPGSLTSPAWSHDGVAFIGRDLDVWLIAADGHTAARRLTRGADAMRIAWDRATGALWVTGMWGNSGQSIRVVDVKTLKSHTPPVSINSNGRDPSFDISWDGHRIAFAARTVRGHLWLQSIGRSVD
jgi:Tol biopolymer transport system component